MDVDDIERVAVLGAGRMGHGIAELAAMAGFDVRLRDVSRELVEAGLDRIEWSLDKLVEHGRLDAEAAGAALDRVDGVVDLESAVAEADVVIEAVPERMAVKREVYAEIDDLAPDRAVFCSNTSSLSITALAATTDRPERFCGMHFFNPPVRMALVEVIAGAETSEETLELVEALAEAMGKTPIRVRKDSPGFVVNRIATPLMNEAAWLVHDDGATVAEVDSTTKFGMGLPMGAFELTDYVGIDIAHDVLVYMEEELGAAYEACPVIEAKVEAGALGEKAGRGFYDYDDGGVEVPAGVGRDDVEARLLAVMANEVAKLVEADVADVAEIDRAVELGLGFPRGPARLADDYGLEALLGVLEAATEATGHPRYEPADLLVEYAAAGRSFHGGDASDAAGFEELEVRRTGRVGRITIDRPHRMNTLTEATFDELERALEDFEADDRVRSVLLTGAGDRAFSAGADVTAFGAGLSAADAEALARLGQRTFGRLESSDLVVVAGIDGYCLGGGMELATACDIRIASDRSTFGQPELDLGLMPGWGGTQRLRHVIGEGRAREVILTAERYDAATMEAYGFVSETVEAAALEERALEVAADVADGPPIAQRLTKRAMLVGRDDTEAGLEAEAEAFGELMATDDLVEGVTAFLEDREPEFEGT